MADTDVAGPFVVIGRGEVVEYRTPHAARSALIRAAMERPGADVMLLQVIAVSRHPLVEPRCTTPACEGKPMVWVERYSRSDFLCLQCLADSKDD